MAALRAADVLGRVTLVTGKEEFLGERTVVAARAAVRHHDAEAEISETAAGDLTMGTLGELAAPSLFSSTRCIVVRALENLPDDTADGLTLHQPGCALQRIASRNVINVRVNTSSVAARSTVAYSQAH